MEKPAVHLVDKNLSLFPGCGKCYRFYTFDRHCSLCLARRDATIWLFSHSGLQNKNIFVLQHKFRIFKACSENMTLVELLSCLVGTASALCNCTNFKCSKCGLLCEGLLSVFICLAVAHAINKSMFLFKQVVHVYSFCRAYTMLYILL